MENASKNHEKLRQVGAAEAFINSRVALGHVAFSMNDLLKETGLSIIAARNQLLRLKHRVIRISPRQSFFLIVQPEHQIAGAPPVTWWLQDYFNWLHQPYYLALQSAASLYGSNPGALQVTQVMTNRPCKTIKLGRTQIKFFVKKNIGKTQTQELPQAAAPLQISTPEATVFDLICYSAKIGGIEPVIETIVPLLPLLRSRELREVIEIENKPAVTQRLGFLIERYGSQKLSQVVYKWLPRRLVLVPLSTSNIRSKNIDIVRRWHIINNSGEPKF